MARILAISSLVAHGHVGLSAIVPALNRLGHEVIALPTVLLSNHPRHAQCAFQAVAPAKLNEMLDALDGNSWLRETHAILTGYLPSAAHVRFAASAAARVSARQPQAEFFCDPVMGDDPNGLYIDEDAARAIRDELFRATYTGVDWVEGINQSSFKVVREMVLRVDKLSQEAVDGLDSVTGAVSKVIRGSGEAASEMVSRTASSLAGAKEVSPPVTASA